MCPLVALILPDNSCGEKLERNFLIPDFLPVRVSLFCQLELQQLIMDPSWCKYGSCVACFHFLLRPLGAPEPWSATLTAFRDDLQASVPAAITVNPLWCSYRCFLTRSVGLFSKFSLLRDECFVAVAVFNFKCSMQRWGVLTVWDLFLF